jgi:hypothetical protein
LTTTALRFEHVDDDEKCLSVDIASTYRESMKRMSQVCTMSDESVTDVISQKLSASTINDVSVNGVTVSDASSVNTFVTQNQSPYLSPQLAAMQDAERKPTPADDMW